MRMMWPALRAGAAGVALTVSLVGIGTGLAHAAMPDEATTSAAADSPSPTWTGGGSLTPVSDDYIPPSRPTDLTVDPVNVTGELRLTWTASTDNLGAVAGYEVYLWQGDGFGRVAWSVTNSATVSGLVPGRSYLLYVVARDAFSNISRPSDLVRGVPVAEPPTPPASPAPDTQAPSVPTGLRACATDLDRAVRVCWNAATDDVGVAGYDVFRQTATGYVGVGGTTDTYVIDSGLVAGLSYTYQVVARDAAGNLSVPSDPFTTEVSLPTSSSPSPSPSALGCTVTYGVNGWDSGFTANLTIDNTGTSAISDWTLRFTFPGDQMITSGWSATWTQTGAQVTATALDWNATVNPGETLSLGFNASYSGADPAPSDFSVNGITCESG